MRVHIELDDALVAQIDQRAGSRNRSRFIREAISSAVEDRLSARSPGRLPRSQHFPMTELTVQDWPVGA